MSKRHGLALSKKERFAWLFYMYKNANILEIIRKALEDKLKLWLNLRWGFMTCRELFEII